MTTSVEIGGTKSTFGTQVLSKRQTAPYTKFGTSKRSDPVYLEGCDDLLLGTVSPGFNYDPKSALGSQVLSKNATSPSYRFGARGDLSVLPADPGPGPGSYTAPSSLGPQLLSTRGNFETAKFKTGNRWSNFKSDFWADFYCPSHVVGDGKMPAGNLGDAPSYSFSGKGGRYDPMKQGTPGNVPSYLRNPGPGDYTQGSSFGRQLVSRKATAPTGKIGTDTRDKRSKLYYSPQHEKEWQGQHSPGPNYDPVSSIGQQRLSKKKNSSGFKFGSGDRFSEIKPVEIKRGETGKSLGGTSLFPLPGPGEYTV